MRSAPRFVLAPDAFVCSLGRVARYVLANDVNYLGNILVAGKIIDSNQYDIQALQASRALLYPYNATMADRARELDALRYRGQALDFGTAQAMDIVGSFNDANFMIASSRNQTICLASIMVDALLGGTSINETIGAAVLTGEIDLAATSLNETTTSADITVAASLVANSVNETVGAATITVEVNLAADSVTETVGAAIITVTGP